MKQLGTISALLTISTFCATAAHAQLLLHSYALVCGVGYLDESWDAGAKADVAVPRADGSMGKASANVGEVCSQVIAPYEIYVDGRATQFDRARYIIRETRLELASIEERYGVKVEPDNGAVQSFFDAHASFGFRSTDNKSEKRMATVRIMWERPTPRYPEGRTIVTCGDRLIYAGPMPLADKDRFPIARLAYDEAAEHPYGLGLVRDLAPLQIEVNRLLTKVTNQIEDSKNTLLRFKGDGAGADAYSDDDDIEEKRTHRTVFYRAMPPTWQEGPGVTDGAWKMIDLNWLHMQHIAGVHDVNMGGTTGGVTAGISIDLLQQGDRTQMSLFTQRMEQFAVDRDTIDISLYAQHAAPYLPRMMALDTSGNPQVAQFRAVAFQALTAGGTVEVVVTPGSATPKTPANQKNDILTYFQMGLLDPTRPDAEIAISLLPDAASSKIQQAFADAKQRMQAEAQAQQQAQMEQQMAMQQAQDEQAAVERANQPDPRAAEETRAQATLAAQDNASNNKIREMVVSRVLQGNENNGRRNN